MVNIMTILMKKAFVTLAMLIATGALFAAPTVDDWQPKISKNRVLLNTDQDTVLLEATVLAASSDWYTGGNLEFGIYSFAKKKNGRLKVKDSLALITPAVAGATGSVEFDLLNGNAVNEQGDTAAIGKRFGWYLSNGFTTRYSHPTLNNFGFDYLLVDKKHSDEDVDLYWEMYFANCDDWFNDLTLALDFSLPQPVAVTEPQTLGLLATMFGMLFFVRRRVKR